MDLANPHYLKKYLYLVFFKKKSFDPIKNKFGPHKKNSDPIQNVYGSAICIVFWISIAYKRDLCVSKVGKRNFYQHISKINVAICSPEMQRPNYICCLCNPIFSLYRLEHNKIVPIINIPYLKTFFW